MQKRKRILIICPYPLKGAPSQRFRFEQYLGLLTETGYDVETHPFLSPDAWLASHRMGGLHMLWVIKIGFLKRLLLLFGISRFDFVFIHREAAPVGPPVIEWLIAHVFRKKVIYDFDDAIWLTDRTDEGKFRQLIKSRSKVASICRWSFKVSCGNKYLAQFALKFNSNTVIIPTTIDTRHYHNPGLSQSEKNPHRVCIGWTGSHSTLKYLKALEPVLQRLAETRPSVDFIFTADLDPSLDLPRTTFIPWHLSNEISTLMKLDIGIMPLPDDPWTQGKGGFKALQYLALEIPAVVSPVGINQEIITDAVNGYLASTGEEWLDALTRLVDDKTHRVQLGQAGRKGVEAHYSVDAVAPLFLKLFE